MITFGGYYKLVMFKGNLKVPSLEASTLLYCLQPLSCPANKNRVPVRAPQSLSALVIKRPVPQAMPNAR